MGEGDDGDASGSKEPILEEYYYLQKIVSEINGQCLTIKSWGATIAAAAATFTVNVRTPAVFFVIATAAVALWFTEAFWRRDQKAFIDRIRAIENAANRKSMPSPRISLSYDDHLKRENFWHHLVRLITMLPNAWIALMAVTVGALWLWFSPLSERTAGQTVEMKVEQTAR